MLQTKYALNMPQSNELAFVNPGQPVLRLRPGQMSNMGPQSGPNPQLVNALASQAGSGNFGAAFDAAVDYGASTLGVPRGYGGAASKIVRETVGGFASRRAKQPKTATNARRGGGGDQSPPGAADGAGSQDRRKRERKGAATSARGGSPLIFGNEGTRIKLPVLVGHLSTIEGGPLPTINQGTDYVSQLHVAMYSFSTWDSTVNNGVNIYNPNSIKNKQVELIFGRLLNDLLQQVTTRFTEDFDLTNFREYMNAFIISVEYITYLESVLAYDSKRGYSDKFIANEHLQEVFTAYEIIDAIKRLKTVLKNKYFPPKMMGLIHSTFQLYKNNNLEQSVNFRFCPIPDSLPILNTFEDMSGYDARVGEIRAAILNKIESLIARLSLRESTLISKALGFIKPSYIFDSVPPPSSTAVYDPMFVELMINLPRLYKADNDATKYVFPTATAGVDRTYNVPQEVTSLNSTVFAMQSMPVSETAVTTTDYTNFGTTFPHSPSSGDAVVWGNFMSMTSKLNGTTVIPGFELENSIESIAIGRTNILYWDTNEISALPNKKYSITPPHCQRVYFNNTFAPTDAVRKLVDDILDMN